MDRRLQDRYMTLVEAHLHVGTRVAAGMAHLPDLNTPFAATQAAWRFLNNDAVTLPALMQPLHQAGRTAAAESRSPWLLSVHDWSTLAFGRHHSKRDRLQLTHDKDVGYDLAVALLVGSEDGAPLAPMDVNLETANRVLSTRGGRAPRRGVPHVDQVLATMNAARAWDLPADKRLVHVIDREVDSVRHFRAWDKAGHYFLVRADDRRVFYQGEEWSLNELRDHLWRQKEFRFSREVQWHGQAARQQVAEIEVTLHRPAKQRKDGWQREVPGRALPLRLVLTQVTVNGVVQAEWFLLSNVPGEVSTAELALWYYFRWRIESYFKLLKGAGQELEHWQQETGLAIARRLLVASMACVVVWRLQTLFSPEAEELKVLLVRLSGRTSKRGKAASASALLAGLHVLLSMLALLEHYDLDHLRGLVDRLLPTLNTG